MGGEGVQLPSFPPSRLLPQSIFARRAALAATPGAQEAARAKCGSSAAAAAVWRSSTACPPPLPAPPRRHCSVLTSPFGAFESAFNGLWADNADALSSLYTGTGAQKTDFTRTGRRTTAGKARDLVISLRRWVLNNFVDGRTQDAWDLFLGRFIPRKAGAEGSADAKKHQAAAQAAARRATPAAAHLAGPSPVRAERGEGGTPLRACMPLPSPCRRPSSCASVPPSRPSSWSSSQCCRPRSRWACALASASAPRCCCSGWRRSSSSGAAGLRGARRSSRARASSRSSRTRGGTTAGQPSARTSPAVPTRWLGVEGRCSRARRRA